MNRDIRFRQYLLDEKRMLSWEELCSDEEESLSATMTQTFPNASPLMQFTGLFDKGNTPIYEGDIIRMHPEDLPKWDRQIIWKSGGFWCTQIRGAAKYPLVFEQLSPSNEWQVIGNIFEHPDLLK